MNEATQESRAHADGANRYTARRSAHVFGLCLAAAIAGGVTLPGPVREDALRSGSDHALVLATQGAGTSRGETTAARVVSSAGDGDPTLASSGVLPVRVRDWAPQVPSSDPGAPVTIQDSGLRARIAAALGKPDQAVIGAQELAALQGLDVRSMGIADLTGLEGAINLEAVDLGHNPIEDFRVLARLPRLTALNLDATGADPWAIAALTGLERLSLRDNGILNAAPLAGLTRLEVLDLAGNAVADVTPLASLTALQVLDLRGTPTPDLTPLADLRVRILTDVGGRDR